MRRVEPPRETQHVHQLAATALSSRRRRDIRLVHVRLVADDAHRRLFLVLVFLILAKLIDQGLRISCAEIYVEGQSVFSKIRGQARILGAYSLGHRHSVRKHVHLKFSFFRLEHLEH